MTQQELINQGYVLKETIKCSAEKGPWDGWIKDVNSKLESELMAEEDSTKEYYHAEIYIYEKPKK